MGNRMMTTTLSSLIKLRQLIHLVDVNLGMMDTNRHACELLKISSSPLTSATDNSKTVLRGTFFVPIRATNGS